MAGPAGADADAVATVLAPRTGVVAECLLDAPDLPTGDGGTWRFGQGEGPLAAYERLVTVGADGAVTQTVSLRVGLAPLGWLFGPPLRRLLGRVGPDPGMPWWLPPARLPRRAAVVLALLCLLQVFVGYLGDLLAYTMTYAGSEFGVGSAGQGVALGISQLSAVVALPVLAVADRRRRRDVLVATLAAAAVLTGVGAATPSLWSLTASQVAAGAAAGAAAVLVGVLIVEEVPAGARAWSLGVATMCVGLGSGVAVAAIPLAGYGPGGWRWLYALGLLTLPPALVAARRLPATAGPGAGRAVPGRRRWDPTDRRNLLLLGAGGFLLALFTDPGGSLQAQYLRHERHLSPLAISILLQVTGTIGGLGTLVGGRLADTRGRRPVAAIGVLALAGTTLAVYVSRGAGLWVWESLSSATSYGVAPALGVYGAELFPTGLRGKAGGVITVAGAAGGLAGLAAAGVVSGRTGHVAPALAALAAGPLLVAALVVVAYPETAGRPLLEMHPEDRPS